MNKRKKSILSLFLAALLLVSWLPAPPAQAAAADPILRIGLYYGSNGLPAANLQNVTGYGSGYRLGYFSGDQFTSLLETSTVEITVLKDKQLYINGEKDYYDVAPASYHTVIRPYHLQTSRTFSSASEAQNFAQSLSSLGAFPAYVNGSYVVRIGQYSSTSEAQAAQSAVSAQAGAVSVCGYSESCYTVTKTGTNTILFELDSGGNYLGIQPMGAAKTQTWFKGFKYYGAFEYKRMQGNDLTVINVVGLTDYVKGVIPYEMSASWPVEALKAQALCTKSYSMNSLGKHSSQGFDLCNSTDCQVYQGTNAANANSDSAVDAVYGQYILYDGQVAQAYYHASSGGATEDVENIWTSYVPYLRGVEDTYLKNPVNWSATFTNETVAAILRSKGYSVGNVTNVYVSHTTSHGNVDGLTVEQDSGEDLVFSKSSARSILNSSAYGVSILSHRYTISGGSGSGGGNVDGFTINGQPFSSLSGMYAIGSGGIIGSVSFGNLSAITGSGTVSIPSLQKARASSGTYTVTGTGNGHHIGLSQWGANGMANAGFSYEDIIKFYFTGVQVGPAA